jgi:hypothetical protein
LYDKKKDWEFMINVMFPSFTSLLDVPEGICIPPEEDDNFAFLLSFIQSAVWCLSFEIWRIRLCGKEGAGQFGKILWFSFHPILARCRAQSCRIMGSIFNYGQVGKVKWVVREGGLMALVR